MLPKVLEDLDRRRPEEPDAVAEELQEIWPKLKETREIDLAYGIMGSCLRHKGEISAAIFLIEKGLEKATEEWDRAQLLRRKSIAVSATGDFETAFGLSDLALVGYLHVGYTAEMGRVISDQAMWRFHQAEYCLCVAMNQLALGLLDSRDLIHRVACHQGIALALAETGDLASCIDHIQRAREMARELGPVTWARFLWLEAKLARQANRLDLAIRALREVRASLLQAGEVFDASIASVTLVETLFEQGEVEEAVREGRKCRELLLQLPESSSAVPILGAIWRQAETGSLSSQLVQAARTKLDRAGAERRPLRR